MISMKENTYEWQTLVVLEIPSGKKKRYLMCVVWRAIVLRTKFTDWREWNAPILCSNAVVPWRYHWTRLLSHGKWWRWATVMELWRRKGFSLSLRIIRFWCGSLNFQMVDNVLLWNIWSYDGILSPRLEYYDLQWHTTIYIGTFGPTMTVPIIH